MNERGDCAIVYMARRPTSSFGRWSKGVTTSSHVSETFNSGADMKYSDHVRSYHSIGSTRSEAVSVWGIKRCVTTKTGSGMNYSVLSCIT